MTSEEAVAMSKQILAGRPSSYVAGALRLAEFVTQRFPTMNPTALANLMRASVKEAVFHNLTREEELAFDRVCEILLDLPSRSYPHRPKENLVP